MKYLLNIFLLLPIFIFAQPRGNTNAVDSIGYIKLGGQWFKKEYRASEVPEVYTTEDSLVAKTLVREQLDLSRQLREAYLDWRKTERYYKNRLRQNKSEYKKHFNDNISVDSLVDSKELIGNWLLNNEAITISKTLRVKSNKIDFVSDVQFDLVIGSEKKTFFKLEDNWVTDDELYKLRKVKAIKR